MTDSSDARSKAETCVRLASAVQNLRTLELLKQLADEYWAKAGVPSDTPDAPPLAPLPDSDLWIAQLRALREQT